MHKKLEHAMNHIITAKVLLSEIQRDSPDNELDYWAGCVEECGELVNRLNDAKRSS